MNRSPVSTVERGMRRLTTLIAVLVLGALITACSESNTDSTDSPEDDGGAEAEITIDDFTFSGVDSVSVVDTVQVTNNDSVGHTWTAVNDAFHSGILASGDTFEFTFDEAGEFDYFCQIHPQMTGTIAVEG
jgi:plastocyanin